MSKVSKQFKSIENFLIDLRRFKISQRNSYGLFEKRSIQFRIPIQLKKTLTRVCLNDSKMEKNKINNYCVKIRTKLFMNVAT